MRSLFACGIALAVLAGSCSNIGSSGHLVGATCASDYDCESRCLLGERHYPGGLCTVTCASDSDCPSGTSCVDDGDGICAVSCANNSDCAGFGRGFVCDTQDRRGTQGSALVCRAN